MKKYLTIVIFLFSVFILLINLDFTSQLNKQLLNAQKKITTGNLEEAAQIYQNILINNIDKKLRNKIIFNLADLYSTHLQRSDKAIEILKKIINDEDIQDQLQASERISEIYFTIQKKYLLSINIYKKLSEIRPKLENHDLYEYRLAQGLYETNQFLKSLEILQKINPQKDHLYRIESYYYIALCYFNLKNWKKAIVAFQEYINVSQDTNLIVISKFLIGNCYEMIDQLRDAYSAYYAILGEYPNSEIIKMRIKSVYERKVSRKR